MNRYILLMTIATLCTTLAAGAETRTLSEIEEELVPRWDKTNTYTAKVEMKGETAQGLNTVKMEGKGDLEGMKKNGKMLYRLELDQTILMGDSEMPNKMLVVFTGDQMFTETSMMGQTMVFKAKPEQQAQSVPGGGRESFKQLRANYDITVLPDEKINDEPVYVLEMRPKEKAQQKPQSPAASQQFEKSVLYIAQKTGFPLKMLMFGEDETPIMSLVYKDYKLDPELDPARFEYTPPAGAMVMDANMFQQQGQTP